MSGTSAGAHKSWSDQKVAARRTAAIRAGISKRDNSYIAESNRRIWSDSKKRSKRIASVKEGFTRQVKATMSSNMKEIWSRPGVREAKRKTMIEYRQASKYRKSMSAAVKKSWDKSPPKRRQEAAKVYRNIGQFVLNAPPIQIMVGKKVPDILHVEKPVAIELFGDYWHSEGRTGLSRQGAEKERKDHFKKYGFRTVVIWESEMYEDTVRNKVRRVLK